MVEYQQLLWFNSGFPGCTSGKELACRCRRHKRYGFDLWVGKSPWRRKWQPTPVFLHGEAHGQRSLAGYSLKGCKESETTEVTYHAHTYMVQFNSFASQGSLAS